MDFASSRAGDGPSAEQVVLDNGGSSGAKEKGTSERISATAKKLGAPPSFSPPPWPTSKSLPASRAVPSLSGAERYRKPSTADDVQDGELCRELFGDVEEDEYEGDEGDENNDGDDSRADR